MISAKKMKKYFDENTAKMIIGKMKDHIKYGGIDPSFVGRVVQGTF
jgi:hypothetical protein